MVSVERNINNACLLHAYVLCSSEASKYLVEVLESVSPSDLEDVIEKVLDAVEKQPCVYITDV